MSDNLIELQQNGRLAKIVLQRPAESNAFTHDMLAQLLAALRQAADSSDILLLSALGEDFSVGRDRAERRTDVSMLEAFKLITDVNSALASYSGISIAVGRGKIFGLGIGLMMRSDITLVSSNARFMLDEIKIGISPMFIMSEILEHLAPKQAADIIFSSREFDAEEARQMGLISRVLPDRQLDSAGDSYVEHLLARAPHAVRASKAYFKQIRQVPPAARPAFALVEQIASMKPHA